MSGWVGNGSPCGADDTTEADGYVVLVVDPVTGHGDCFGPYRDAARARGEVEWRRLEFDLADLPDVAIGLLPWHEEGADDRSG